MTQCSQCECTNLVLGNSPRWVGREIARTFNIAQCSGCKRYVNASTGRPVMPTVRATLALQVLGAVLVVVLGSVGYSRGGSPALWFGVPFALFF